MQKKHFIFSCHAAETARQCASIIYTELGINLNISNPDFLQSVSTYAAIIQSKELLEAYQDLSTYNKLSSRIH